MFFNSILQMFLRRSVEWFMKELLQKMDPKLKIYLLEINITIYSISQLLKHAKKLS
jgi:hypothetical protein